MSHVDLLKVVLPVVAEDESLLPAYANPGDAGLDLFCVSDVVLQPNVPALVQTGVSVAIPDGFVGFITPRSGLALKKAVTVLNAPGTIDSGYRGPLGVILISFASTTQILPARSRVAQLVLVPFAHAQIQPVADLNASVRGSGGFGSSGF